MRKLVSNYKYSEAERARMNSPLALKTRSDRAKDPERRALRAEIQKQLEAMKPGTEKEIMGVRVRRRMQESAGWYVWGSREVAPAVGIVKPYQAAQRVAAIVRKRAAAASGERAE